MKVEKLTVNNFRNLAQQDIQFEPGLNVIYGPNGAGKTNILEALYMLSIGRSPRTRKDEETVLFKEKQAELFLDYERCEVSRDVGLQLNVNKGKLVMLDGIASKKVSDIIGNFASVYFSPDEIEIVRGGPQYRRRFMDIVLCQINKDYMESLRNFQHALKQRNAILRSCKLSKGYDPSLQPWDAQLIPFNLRVMAKRAKFIKRIELFAGLIHRIMTEGRETLRLTYKTFCDRLTDISVGYFSQEYQRKMRASYVRDVATGTSNIGCHLDDIDIKLGYITNDTEDKANEKINWTNLRTSGSLGQQRTATLAIKIAEIYVLQIFYQEAPILLLDDVLSELDATRRETLLRFCNRYQTILTCTEWNHPEIPASLYRVNNGVVTKEQVNTQFANDAPDIFTEQVDNLPIDEAVDRDLLKVPNIEQDKVIEDVATMDEIVCNNDEEIAEDSVEKHLFELPDLDAE